MTPVKYVYEAFLAKLLEDEWLNWEEEEIKADWRELLNGAIPFFKFPRVSLDIDVSSFYMLFSQVPRADQICREFYREFIVK